jgi:eukaryotic-like serine/threonine-protein kinase
MNEGTARVVVGRYRLVRPVGRGGMGAVWHAHDTLLGRDVAIKEIWLPSAGDEPVDPADPLIRRALREAQAAARLRHPGIVTVYDVVTDEGRPWIVMELINGRSLAEAIQEHGLLTEQRTAEIGLQVLDALRAAHREGIAHRDVKPANILLDAADRVVLTDFGIAAVDDATALTATGQMVGSPAYLAPERINGQPATAASDLWALGVTLYTTVTGRSPFQREDTQTTFAAILTSRPTTPAHAGRLWPVIKDLLVKDPAGRLAAEQARGLLANVASIGAADPAGPAPGGRGSRWRPARSKRRESTLDGLPGTLTAPPPTLAANTAYQNPAQGRGPGAAIPLPRQAKPEPATVEEHAPGSAAAPADDTAPASTAEITSAHHQTPADTAAADTVPAETAAAETAAAETVAAETVAAETVGLAAVSPIPMTPAPGTPAVTPVPLASYPEVVRRPRSARTRTVWLAALGVGAVLLAGGILRIAWPGSGDNHATGRGPVAGSSGGSPALAGGKSVNPAAQASPVASASVNPSLDSCLVGTWRMTSMQVVNHFDGVDARFTSSGGAISRIWPDGRGTDDYNRSAPLTATIKGARYVEVLRGVKKSHNETRSGKLYASEFSGGPTFKVTRNGKVQSINVSVSASENLPYICTETRLTTYGDAKSSTQSYQRTSHTP